MEHILVDHVEKGQPVDFPSKDGMRPWKSDQILSFNSPLLLLLIEEVIDNVCVNNTNNQQICITLKSYGLPVGTMPRDY